MAWDIQFRKGVWLPQVGWWLDARRPSERVLVSHAHSDHLGRHREVVCTGPTARFMSLRLPSKTRREHILPYDHTERLTADSQVTLHSAGHMLGSAQILIEHEEHGRLLYTGDFKLRPGHSAPACVVPSADTLIMETTFGRPRYVFPPEEDVVRQLIAFCRQTLADQSTPVLFCYSLGKSQEVLSALAPAGLPLMLHPETFRLTRLYEEAGQNFPAYREFNREEASGHVILCPPHARNAISHLPGLRTAMITGWALDPGAKYRYRCDEVFPLSDHADFNDLLRFVERVRPRRVLTLHGFAADFAATLRARGIEAWALDAENQLEMALTDSA
ncbi:MAG: MBL fold metallo-hydrolase [Verrucomicrobia bacterium]|nr:MBL fold metallo-hydrolase [Verrucomicrobiota bacterium]